MCLLTLKKSGEVLGRHFFTLKPGRGRDCRVPPTALVEPRISCPVPHSVTSIKSHGRTGALPTLCAILSKSVGTYLCKPELEDIEVKLVQDFNDRRKTLHLRTHVANNLTSERGRDEEREGNAGFGLEFSLEIITRGKVKGGLSPEF